jgi:predicted TIM-barrel fold metal-dependent hydrolase
MNDKASAFSATAADDTVRIAHGAGCLCGMSRRKFMAGAIAAGATAVAAPRARAQAPARTRIDVHHHMLPPKYIQERLNAGTTEGSTEVAGWTPARTLEQLDRNGIQTAMLSLSQPGLKFDDIEGTRSMLRYVNEYGAELVRDHPGRFGLMATLPLADIDGSLRELEYAFDVLKADGVGLLTSYGTRYPGNPHFDPVFAELNRRKAVAFFHPNMPACCVGILPDVPGPTIEYQFNTARAVTNLLYTGTLAKYPDIKYIFCHSGGAMIPQVGRIIRHAQESKRIAERLPNGALAEIRKLHFDTAQAADPWNFGAARTYMPVTQILMGSDYPYVQVSDTVESLLKLDLSEADLRAVTRENALRLFPRLRSA